MLRRLRDAWGKFVSSIPKSEIVDSIPEDQWGHPKLVPRVSKAKRAAFEELLAIVFAHHPEQWAKHLAAERTAHFERADEADVALERAITEFESVEARTAASAAIVCDWKAEEELEWQAALLGTSLGLKERWSSPRRGLEADLGALASWLRLRDVVLIEFSSGDNVVAFAVQPAYVDRVKALGQRLQVSFRLRSEA